MADQEDQGLSQADIDAALAAAGGGLADPAESRSAQASAPAPAQADIAPSPQIDSDAASIVEQATLAESALTDVPAAESPASTEAPEDDIAAAMAAEIEREALAAASAAPRGSKPMPLPALDDNAALADGLARGIEMLGDVELSVRVELGRAEKTVEEVLNLDSGSVVELDRLAGDPVDILVNEKLVARGEVLVLNDNLCIRICEILNRPIETVSA